MSATTIVPDEGLAHARALVLEGMLERVFELTATGAHLEHPANIDQYRVKDARSCLEDVISLACLHSDLGGDGHLCGGAALGADQVQRLRAVAADVIMMAEETVAGDTLPGRPADPHLVEFQWSRRTLAEHVLEALGEGDSWMATQTRIRLEGRDLEAARMVAMVGVMSAYSEVRDFSCRIDGRWRLDEVFESLELLSRLGFGDRSVLNPYGMNHGGILPEQAQALLECADRVDQRAEFYVDDDGTDEEARPVYRLQRQLAHRVMRAVGEAE